MRICQYLTTSKFRQTVTMKVTNNILLVITTSFTCHCVKRVQIRRYFWSVFSCIQENTEQKFFPYKSYCDQNIMTKGQFLLIVFCCKSLCTCDGSLRSFQDVFMVSKGYIKLFLFLVVAILKKMRCCIYFTVLFEISKNSGPVFSRMITECKITELLESWRYDKEGDATLFYF